MTRATNDVIRKRINEYVLNNYIGKEVFIDVLLDEVNEILTQPYKIKNTRQLSSLLIKAPFNIERKYKYNLSKKTILCFTSK